MSLIVFSYFYFLEMFIEELVTGMYLKLKTFFWSKNYVPETSLNNFSFRATSKFQMTRIQKANVTTQKTGD